MKGIMTKGIVSNSYEKRLTGPWYMTYRDEMKKLHGIDQIPCSHLIEKLSQKTCRIYIGGSGAAFKLHCKQNFETGSEEQLRTIPET